MGREEGPNEGVTRHAGTSSPLRRHGQVALETRSRDGDRRSPCSRHASQGHIVPRGAVAYAQATAPRGSDLGLPCQPRHPVSMEQRELPSHLNHQPLKLPELPVEFVPR